MLKNNIKILFDSLHPEDVNTVWGMILGVTVDIITGGTLGLLIIYLFKFTGRDYWWYKGLIIGNAIWLWGLGVTINFGASRIVPLDPIFRLTSLVEHQIFGLVGAYLIVKWYPETNNQSKEQEHTIKIPLKGRFFPVPARKNEKEHRKKVKLKKPKKIQ